MKEKREKNEGWGCEPTYEELKLLFAKQEGVKVESCEPTYEELKHKNVIEVETKEGTLRAYL